MLTRKSQDRHLGSIEAAQVRRTRSRGRAGLPIDRVAGRALGYLVLVLLTAVCIFPFLWMVLTSVRPNNTVFAGGVIPRQVTGAAYQFVWSQLGILHYFWNSVWITTVSVAVILALATLAGYSFAQLDFAGKQVIFVVLLSTLMLPATAIIVPLFVELKNFHLIDTQAGLICVYVGTALPFAMFLMRSFFETLPAELADAARIDGAGELGVFWRVMLPLAAPGIAAVTIFEFMLTWNEFIFAATLIQTPGLLPLQPVLYSLIGQYSTNWADLTAALTVSVLPIVVVYVLMQRWFVAGLTIGAVKA
jgi:ABC-type glycerol-3-phosphate transport system permease component